MTFGVYVLKVIHPLYPYQCLRFKEPMDDVEQPNLLDQLYRLIIGKREDYINLVVVGSII